MKNRGRPATISTQNNPLLRRCLNLGASEWDYLDDVAKKWGGSKSAYVRMLVRADSNSNFADDTLLEREIKEHEAAIALRKERLQENADKREKKLKEELLFKDVVERDAAHLAEMWFNDHDDVSFISSVFKNRCANIKEKHNIDISGAVKARSEELFRAKQRKIEWQGLKITRIIDTSKNKPLSREEVINNAFNAVLRLLTRSKFSDDLDLINSAINFWCLTAKWQQFNIQDDFKNSLTDAMLKINKKLEWDGTKIKQITDISEKTATP